VATWYAVGLLREPSDIGPYAGILDLGNGVTLGSIPAWLRAAEMETEEQPNLHWPYIAAITGYPMFVLVHRYEADAPYSEPDPAWPNSADNMTKARAANDRLMVANLTAWLVQPKTTLRFGTVLHVEQRADGQLRIRHHLHPAQFRPEPDRPGVATLTEEHFVEIRTLNETIGSLTRQGPLWTALRSLWRALTEGWFHNRYMLLWIALEALFGPKGRADVTRRLTRNLSLFLARDAEQQAALWTRATQDYDRRSGIAHGEGGRVEQAEWVELILRAEDWLRLALVRIVQDPALRATFSETSRRQALFADLARAAGLLKHHDS
jgi:hypothetical protein